MPKFIKTELKSDSELDLDSDLEKMEAKIDKELEGNTDNDSVYDIVHLFFLPCFFILSGSLFWGLINLIWHHLKHSISLFLRLIKPFIELFNSGGSGI